LPGVRQRVVHRWTWALAALVAAGFATGCGASNGSSTTTTKGGQFAGSTASPRRQAPALTLADYRGRRVSLGQYRGNAVLVTFIYTHCPDVCPLIVGHLKTVRAKLGPEAKKLRIVAVSTDPLGDTPASVTRFLRAHGMIGAMDYLIGNRRELTRVWKRWGVAAKPGSTRKLRRVYKRNGVKGGRAGAALVEHTALVYGISASGKLTTLYPSNFEPAEIVHDVPRLAGI
jgi:protein SCO1/2